LKKLLYHFQEAAGNVTLDSESFTIKSNNSNKEVKPDTNNSDSGSKGSGNGDVSIPWSQIQKRQVSPASQPKYLLKLILKGNPQQIMKKPPPSFLKLEQTWKIFVAIRKNFGLLT